MYFSCHVSTYCKECLVEKREKARKKIEENPLDPEDKMTCSACNEEKLIKQFGKNKAYSSGYFSECKECRKVEVQTVTMSENKRCFDCKLIQPVKAHGLDKSQPDGLDRYCKLCKKARAFKAQQSLVVTPVLIKTCNTCKKDLPAESFWVKKANKDGRENKCKDCHKK